MTDTADGITHLEILVRAHRDELRKNQTTGTTPSGDPILSIEEQLWESVQTKLLIDRQSREDAQKAKEREERKSGFTVFLEKYGVAISLVLSLVVLAISLTIGDDLELNFRYLAIGAAGLGLLAALARLLAHRGSVTLDGVGKMLGLPSAFMAPIAVFALLKLGK